MTLTQVLLAVCLLLPLTIAETTEAADRQTTSAANGQTTEATTKKDLCCSRKEYKGKFFELVVGHCISCTEKMGHSLEDFVTTILIWQIYTN